MSFSRAERVSIRSMDKRPSEEVIFSSQSTPFREPKVSLIIPLPTALSQYSHSRSPFFFLTVFTKIYGTSSFDSTNVNPSTLVDGFIYLGFTTSGTLPGNPAPPGGNDAMSVIKTDLDGNQVLAVMGPATSQDDLYSDIAVDGQGSIYLAGYTTGTGVLGQTNSGGQDWLVTKMNATGGHEFARIMGTPQTQNSPAIHHQGGAVYFTGSTNGAMFTPYQFGVTDSVLMQLVGFCHPDDLTQQSEFNLPCSVCPAGHRVEATANGVTCTPCPKNTYSTSQMSISCAACPTDFITASEGSTSCTPLPGWAVQYGTAGGDYSYATRSCPSGDVFVTGWTSANMPGAISHNTGNSDGFWLRYAKNGTLITTVQFGTPSSGNDYSYALAVDCTNQLVYTAGQTAGNVPGYTNQGSNDAFAMSFSFAGSLLTQYMIGSSGNDPGFKDIIGTKDRNMVFAIGIVAGPVPGESQVGSTDALVVASNSTGHIVWVHQFGSVSSDTAGTIVLSNDEQHVFAIGGSGSSPFDGATGPGGLDIFVTKFTISGTKVLTKLFGTSATDLINSHSAFLGSNDLLYIGFHTQGTFPGFTNAGSYDPAFIKVDQMGNQTMAFLAPGTAGSEAIQGMATDSHGNIYLSGQTTGSFPGTMNAGVQDLFMMKLTSTGSSLWTRLIGTNSTETGGYLASTPQDTIYFGGFTDLSLFGPALGNDDLLIAEAVGTCPQGLPNQESKYGIPCAVCPVGNYHHVEGNYQSCSPCPAGTYSDSPSSSSCSSCPANTFSDSMGSTKCAACPSGMTSASGASKCFWVPGWELQTGTSASDTASGVVTCDSTGESFVSGYTGDTLPGASSSGQVDAFILRYAANGTLLATTQFGTSSSDYAEGLRVDCDRKRIFVVGKTLGAFPSFSNAGSGDAFYRIYDFAGNALTTVQFGSTLDDVGLGVDYDSQQNGYVVGISGDMLGQTAVGGADAFIMKFNQTGSLQWVHLLGSSGTDRAISVSISKDQKHVFMFGRAQTSPFDGVTGPGNADVFVSKFTLSGTKVFTKMYGVGGTDTVDSGVNSFAMTSQGDFWMGFSTLGSFPGYTNAGGYDTAVIKIDQDGNQLHAILLPGSTGTDSVGGIAVDGHDNVYVTGQTSASLPGFVSAGGSDIFIVKLNATGSQQWIRQFGTTEDDSSPSIASTSSNTVSMTAVTSGSLFGPHLGSYDIAVAQLVGVCAPGDLNRESKFNIPCAECPSGHYFYVQNNVTMCSQCPANTFSASASSTNCTACPTGTFSGAGASKCIPDPGWAMQTGTSGEDYPAAIATCNSGDVFVTGRAALGLPGAVTVGSTDAFILHFSANGTLLATIQFGTVAGDVGYGLATDCENQRVYVCGVTFGSFPGYTKVGQNDAFYRLYDFQANPITTVQFGSTVNDDALAIDYDSQRNVYVAGQSGSMLGQTSVQGSLDAYIAKFNSSGGLEWAHLLGSSGSDYATSVLVSNDQQHVFIYGKSASYPFDYVQAGPDTSVDLFVSKFTLSGTKGTLPPTSDLCVSRFSTDLSHTHILSLYPSLTLQCSRGCMELLHWNMFTHTPKDW
eukprot:TRINITY_DN1335_c0_g1_i2.p1 TRINITY_DN1335_c0_g1~~TRINITY_DN1335_c0_g1_i2.p1  ORF type:complete len:1561 (+),score=270.23 TRINITY_DN1335_c0_g1_i2:506-5188(+)